MDEAELSAKDADVLEAIFSADGSLAPSADVPVPANSCYTDTYAELAPATLARFRATEARAAAASTGGDQAAACSLLDALVAEAPRYDSALNNRAQIYRLMGDNDAAMRDLNTVIALARATRAFAEACAQRGTLHRLAGDDEAARRDLETAARHGHDWARREGAALNPVAQLCNATVKEMLERERHGHGGGRE